jgi:CheY-like chemotaxis protein
MEGNRLIYNQEQNCLELHGSLLQVGDVIEVAIMGHWIPGQVHRDASGWYLLTLDHVGIRLQPGVHARFERRKLDPQNEPQEKKLILLVEDDATHASILYQILRQETPHYVYCTSDGDTAWNFLQHIKPNLILLDYLLPHMTGMELYHKIRNNARLQDVPVLMVSAVLSLQEAQVRGVELVRKPFELDEFLNSVMRLLGEQLLSR